MLNHAYADSALVLHTYHITDKDGTVPSDNTFQPDLLSFKVILH